ncbi:MAG: hypothetical protein ACRDLL_06450 [Solirubrobacterales bacterium]
MILERYRGTKGGHHRIHSLSHNRFSETGWHRDDRERTMRERLHTTLTLHSCAA